MVNITLKWLLKIWLQQAVLVLLTVVCFWWFNPIIAYSILIGGLIYWLPNMYFATYAFLFRGARAASDMLASFYRGEIGKFLLSSVGFATAFVLIKPLDVVSLLGAYIVLTLVQWLQLARAN